MSMFNKSLAKHITMGFEVDVDARIINELIIDMEYLLEQFPSKMADHGKVTDDDWSTLYDDIATMLELIGDTRLEVKRLDDRDGVRLFAYNVTLDTQAAPCVFIKRQRQKQLDQ